MSTDILKPPLYNYLGQPVLPDDLTDEQRAVLTATEFDVGVEMALGSDIPGEISAMLAWVKGRGYWAEIKTPFESTPDSLYWAGLTPLSTTGWNGRPDHQVGDVTFRGALWRVILLMLIQERMPVIGGQP